MYSSSRKFTTLASTYRTKAQPPSHSSLSQLSQFLMPGHSFSTSLIMGQQQSGYVNPSDDSVVAISSSGYVQRDTPKGKLVLVIDGNSSHAWHRVFEGSVGPDGLPIRVEQGSRRLHFCNIFSLKSLSCPLLPPSTSSLSINEFFILHLITLSL
jgi:hypothetical protein